MPPFISGIDLSRRLYDEAVAPLMQARTPGLPYAAGLLGAGSDVLGYDTERSTDHDWGPRLVLFLRDEDIETWRQPLDEAFRTSLPRAIAGYSTGFADSDDEPGITWMPDAGYDGPLRHRIVITTPRAFLRDRLGIDNPSDVDPAAWLTISMQALLEVTSGAVFRDDTGEISRIRESLAWYPDDVWRSLMAAQWGHIDQLEPFIGRCGEVGDDLGAQLVAMYLVRGAMRLAFLMERRYWPYPKWFGTAFSRLSLASSLQPHLDRARFATDWHEREAGVVAAVETLARHHNAMGWTEWVDPTTRHFFGRPFTVLFAGRFGEALITTIADPVIRALPHNLGAIDQYLDATDAFNQRGMHHAIRDWLRHQTPSGHNDRL